MIAALFVASDGCYTGLPDVDPWDEARDARLYAGPHPVIAHPPSLTDRQENVNMGVTDGCWKHPSASDQPDLCERFKMADVSIPEVRPIVTRAEAVAAGLKRYFTGKPCSKGHLAERWVNKSSCVKCNQLLLAGRDRAAESKAYYATNKDKLRAKSAAWAKANPEKRSETYKKYRVANAPRIAANKKVWKANNRDKHNAAGYRWRIRRMIALEEFDRLMEAQKGKCAICLRMPVDRRLAIDHCHTTDKIRGLLCGDCNRVLGLMADDPARLRRAADYLE